MQQLDVSIRQNKSVTSSWRPCLLSFAAASLVNHFLPLKRFRDSADAGSGVGRFKEAAPRSPEAVRLLEFRLHFPIKPAPTIFPGRPAFSSQAMSVHWVRRF